MNKKWLLLLISIILGLTGCGYINGNETGTMTVAYVGTEGESILGSREVAPNKTLYFETTGVELNESKLMLDPGIFKVLDNSDLYKVKFDKDDDSKLIKSIKMVNKKLDIDYARRWYVAVELKDNMSDDDFKIGFKLTFTAKKDILAKDYGSIYFPDQGNPGGTGENAIMMTKGSKLVLTAKPVWVKNQVLEGDQTMAAGTGGVVVKPIKNENNEVIWEDDNGNIAQLNFEADSDVNKFFPKLSTKWDDSLYARNFAELDAYLISFIGNPTISSTSRPSLKLLSPFIDKDGEETVAPEDVVIYEVTDSALVDVTKKFTIDEDEDGNTVFVIRTRKLGTYILSNGSSAA